MLLILAHSIAVCLKLLRYRAVSKSKDQGTSALQIRYRVVDVAPQERSLEKPMGVSMLPHVDRGCFLPGGQDFSSISLQSYRPAQLRSLEYQQIFRRQSREDPEFNQINYADSEIQKHHTDKMASQERSMPFIKNLASSGPFLPRALTKYPSSHPTY